MTERLATAPCLLRQLLRYTPQTPAFPYPSSCDHDYVTSSLRSTPPGLDEPSTPVSTWNVQATCTSCHSHLNLAVQYSSTRQPCPTLDFPLHHFRMAPGPRLDERVQTFTFDCCAPLCKARLKVDIRAPVLSREELAYLTDLKALQQRAEEASSQRPQNVAASSPVEALNVLRSYARDATQSDQPKRIPVANRRFMLALGTGAETLLKRLGFVYEDPTNDQMWAHWRLPDAQASVNGDLRMMLQDLEDELMVQMQLRPDTERAKTKEPIPEVSRSIKDMERTLGTLDCELIPHTWSREGSIESSWMSWSAPASFVEMLLICLCLDRALRVDKRATCDAKVRNEIETFAYKVPVDLLDTFSQLGAEADFSDDLLLFAYDRNVIFLPQKEAAFVQHLRAITNFRHTELLLTRMALIDSEAERITTMGDVNAAYSFFDIHPDRSELFSDEQVLGKFQAYAADSGPDQRETALQALSVIARARGSKALENAATQRLETYHDALTFLGADEQTPDEFIVSLVTAKSGEDASLQQLTQDALNLIAEARDSDGLRYQVHRDPSKSNMSLAHAFSLLNLPEEPQPDDETVSVCYGVAVSDNPSRQSEYNEALSVIANARNSAALRRYLNDNRNQLQGAAVERTTSPFEPRGLYNIGNTCYLNSLLQYLFTIKPLREMLQNLDENRQQLDGPEPFVKKVAGMPATAFQVRKAQEFAEELGQLFAVLKKTNSPAATPEVNLARLTIGQPKSSDPNSPSTSTSRRLTISSPRPSSALAHLKNSSHDGKISGDPAGPSAANLDDQKEPSACPQDWRSDRPPFLDAAASCKANEKLSDVSTLAVKEMHESTKKPRDCFSTQPARNSEGQATPAAATLPVDNDSSHKDLKQLTEEWARQQDVADALENVIKQLQWAIKPESIRNTGDQVDLISRLFWGVSRVISVRETGETAEILDFKDFHVYVADDPTELREAVDDSVFGKEEHDDFYKYEAIQDLPPILHIGISRAKAVDGRYVRNTNQLRLHMEIYMDRYMAESHMIERRKEGFKLKANLQLLKTSSGALEATGLGVDAASAIASVSEHAINIESQAGQLDLCPDHEPDYMNENLQGEARDAQQRLVEAKATMQPLQDSMSCLYPGPGLLKYYLQAVFIHIGTTMVAGHWFILIFDHKSDTWRKYNDDRVEVIEPHEVQAMVFEPNEASRGASAYLSYVRADMRHEIFDVVAREPERDDEASALGGDLIQLSEDVRPIGNANTPLQTPRPAWDDDRPEDSKSQW